MDTAGGHFESTDLDVMEAAKRELREETGLVELLYTQFIRLDIHEVPKTPTQDAHQHWDIQLGFATTEQDISGDVRGKWLKREELRSFSHETDQSVLDFLRGWHESFFQVLN